jgi:tetratricopeptide (TPR) repeat protein
MKRLLTLAAAALTLAGCAAVRDVRNQFNNKNPYEKPPFYAKYLNPATSPLDARIQQTVDALRLQPRSAALHNQLGQLLLDKGFPKDAEVEFERSVDADRRFYPGWYNLGLIRAANGNYTGARYALNRAVQYKPGHAAALFQLGLLEEKAQHTTEAVELYAKAFSINHALLDVRVNPRILDSRLLDLALVKLYPNDHARQSMQFQPTPGAYVQRNLEAPSTQPAAQDIVPPTAPVTDPARQTPAPQPGQTPPPQPQPARPPGE